jgi:hypothetical protein
MGRRFAVPRPARRVPGRRAPQVTAWPNRVIDVGRVSSLADGLNGRPGQYVLPPGGRAAAPCPRARRPPALAARNS